MAKRKKISFIDRQRSKKSFLPPGTVEADASLQAEKVVITILQYNESAIQEFVVTNINDLKDLTTNNYVTWMNVDGIHDATIIEKIGSMYEIHPLTLEDVSNTDQRPKFEDYENYVVVMMKMLYYDTELHNEQLSIVLKNNLVITFQESQGGDAFFPIRKRLKEAKGRVRKFGADYLYYALIDAVVDSYFNILEVIGDKIELIDEQLISDPTPDALNILHAMKREMIFLRKSVWPVRDMVNSLERSETTLIQPTTDIYLRDVHDHVVRVIETVENYRDLINGMMDIYLSSLSNRMNEVMKVLTIISTLFIPVTFIVGVYGMNFEYMPELRSPYGYGATWIVMLIIMFSLLYYFRRKKWF
ncbi:MAG TPA: magnesium/cobalt transporter CorA [Bacteroidia bacterium]|nr:magnesium/cobalt transporter CorA [Bacteroidia bacterium]